jgi:hypothetical protein
MKIAVLTFDAFNELDSFVSAALLNRLSGRGWRAYITSATDRVTSRNGVVAEAQKPLEFASEPALGLFSGEPVCTDLMTEPLLTRQGLRVSDQAFYARGNVATAGGCLASQYIAAWIIGRKLGIEQAANVIRHAAPVGQQDEYVSRAIATVGPFLATEAGLKAAVQERIPSNATSYST